MKTLDIPKITSGIMFHHFHGKKFNKSQGSINSDDLFKIIEMIGRKRIINSYEWVERSLKNNFTGSEICLTFDDALKCQIENALPVLNHFGIKAFWFVYSNIFLGEKERLEIYRTFRHDYFDKIDDFYDDFFINLPKIW